MEISLNSNRLAFSLQYIIVRANERTIFKAHYCYQNNIKIAWSLKLYEIVVRSEENAFWENRAMIVVSYLSGQLTIVWIPFFIWQTFDISDNFSANITEEILLFEYIFFAIPFQKSI